MDVNEKEFIAYSRKLLRVLETIRRDVENENYDEAKNILNDLISDTQKDIEG